MKLLNIGGDRRRFAEKREADLLEEHASALMAGRLDEARALRSQQDPELAELMSLAEGISQAVAPVKVSPSSLSRMRRLAEQGLAQPTSRWGALAGRVSGRDAVLGAAIVGTAAIGIGRFAWTHYRKHQEQAVVYSD